MHAYMYRKLAFSSHHMAHGFYVRLRDTASSRSSAELILSVHYRSRQTVQWGSLSLELSLRCQRAGYMHSGVKQKDCKFKVTLGYIVGPEPDQTTKETKQNKIKLE